MFGSLGLLLKPNSHDSGFCNTCRGLSPEDKSRVCSHPGLEVSLDALVR